MERLLAVLLLTIAVTASASCRAENEVPPPSGVDVRVEPELEQNLYSISRVVLVDVAVSRGVLDRLYPGSDTGDPCLILSGTVRNMDPDSTHLVLFAYGYDRSGVRVARTLDVDDGVPGQVLLVLGYGETGTFALHLDAPDVVQSIRVFAFTYAGQP